MLLRELLIGVTAFFRDPEAFSSLAENAIVPLLAGNALRPTRCASGSRPARPGRRPTPSRSYSAKSSRKARNPPRVRIFATDINGRALIGGPSRAHYPQGIATSLSAERLARFFVKRGRRYQVMQELREMVLFSAHNVIADPPFSRLDLISCRNFLIYLGGHLQKKLIPLFHYALRSGGYLFLGSSETLAGHGELFRDIDVRHRLGAAQG